MPSLRTITHPIKRCEQTTTIHSTHIYMKIAVQTYFYFDCSGVVFFCLEIERERYGWELGLTSWRHWALHRANTQCCCCFFMCSSQRCSHQLKKKIRRTISYPLHIPLVLTIYILSKLFLVMDPCCFHRNWSHALLQQFVVWFGFWWSFAFCHGSTVIRSIWNWI